MPCVFLFIGLEGIWKVECRITSFIHLCEHCMAIDFSQGFSFFSLIIVGLRLGAKLSQVLLSLPYYDGLVNCPVPTMKVVILHFSG